MNALKYFVVDNGTHKALELKKKLISILGKWKFDAENPQYIFVLGGDGTLIGSLVRFNNLCAKIVAISAGNFGFFSSFNEKNLAHFISKVSRDINYQKILLLKLRWDGNNFLAVNDVVLDFSLASKVDLFINNQCLERCWNSGFIFSTPLGSTGINKSAMGAVVCPLLDCWSFAELNPIATARFSSLRNPFLLPSNATVTLKGVIGDPNFSLIIDGVKQQNNFASNSLTICCERSKSELFFSWKLEEYVKKIRRLYVRK